MVWIRTQAALQQVVDQAPKAKWYYSDGFDAYQWLWYHFGRYEISKGKAETYSVEANNAELRHYLARLARTSLRWNAPYACLCIASTLDNFTNNVSRIMLLMSSTSLAHSINYSLRINGT